MKKVLLIAILVLSINAFAQEKRIISGLPYQTSISMQNVQDRMNLLELKTHGMYSERNSGQYMKHHRLEQNSLVQIIDSIYTWQWDTLIPGWKIATKIINIVYDANNNLTSEIVQFWDGSAWVNYSKLIFTYDANNNQTSYISQNWDGNTWVNGWKYSNTYDAYNNQTNELIQYWDVGDWVNYYQYISAYDANNNLTSYLSQQWDVSAWVNDCRYTCIYDGNNNITLFFYQIWNSGSWVNYYQACYTYANNNIAVILSQIWDGSAWIDEGQSIYTYDANNNQTSCLHLSWDGSFWVNSELLTSTWDENNNLTSLLHQIWDGSVWVNGFMLTFTYDANNNQTSLLYQYWGGSTWVNIVQVNKTYDADNFMLSESEIDWESSGVNVILGDSTYYYFHTVLTEINDLIVLKENITLYPNPATNKITISTNRTLPGETMISIISISGQQLMQARFQNQKQFEMDVSSLAKGIYLVKIQSNVGVETKKLVVQ